MKILALTILIAFTVVFDLTEGRLTLVGCYNSPNILLESNYFGKVCSYLTTLTREVCASWCYAKSNVLFFGLHHATDCYCLEYGIPKFLGLSAQCTTSCSGPGASTYCGGQYALRVYYESDRYPGCGKYSKYTARAVHIRRTEIMRTYFCGIRTTFFGNTSG
ncbi:hypothetical protein CAPTEDRAFT_192174 [Capitella teleta]|uniref:WSC domain-containing protein n=1 Tax=Capitella teleta TaxID=283909 RepID=R7T7M9_CAPTE|nr:hypothetical protein CAPTEDRAFT_192174 [Capitella teleta]|eukprot:ELT89433.1 hypothetical protein CAPTEDRAFT_192174 [Capitella teleta]